MSDRAARAILQHLGLAAGVSSATAGYECTDGSTATLTARPTVLDSDGAPDWSRNPVVVSLARWDRIKDPLGTQRGQRLSVRGAHDIITGIAAAAGLENDTTVHTLRHEPSTSS